MNFQFELKYDNVAIGFGSSRIFIGDGLFEFTKQNRLYMFGAFDCSSLSYGPDLIGFDTPQNGSVFNGSLILPITMFGPFPQLMVDTFESGTLTIGQVGEYANAVTTMPGRWVDLRPWLPEIFVG